MKYSKIALACSLAISAMASNAAVVPGASTATVIYFSGATAPDNFLADTVRDMLDNEVAIRGTTDANGYRAYLGTAKAGIPNIPTGTPILLMKRSKGGSVWGVNPVGRAQRTEVLDFNNCTAVTSTTADPYSWACATKGTDPGTSGYVNTSANTGLIPDFGVSDVEPKMFQAPFNTENGAASLTATELATMTSSPVNQLMMGIVATAAVAPTTHISRSQYGAMLAGQLDTWNQIDGSEDAVIVCRRVNGSGTQTSYNWFFSGFPCNGASSTNMLPATVRSSAGFGGTAGGKGLTAANPIVVNPAAGFTVVENSGSGDVRNCLTRAQTRVDHAIQGSNGLFYRYEFSKLTAPGKAIGTLSLDSYVQAAATTNWSFRMLDGAGTYTPSTSNTNIVGTTSPGATGIAPSKANLISGKYDFVVELAMQRRTADVTLASGEVVPKSAGIKEAFFVQLVKNLGATKYTGNDGGSFTTTPHAFASLPTAVSYIDKPTFVSPYTRNSDTCQPLQALPSL